MILRFLRGGLYALGIKWLYRQYQTWRHWVLKAAQLQFIDWLIHKFQ